MYVTDGVHPPSQEALLVERLRCVHWLEEATSLYQQRGAVEAGRPWARIHALNPDPLTQVCGCVPVFSASSFVCFPGLFRSLYLGLYLAQSR